MFVCLFVNVLKNSKGQTLKFETSVDEEFRNRGNTNFKNIYAMYILINVLTNSKKNKLVWAAHVASCVLCLFGKRCEKFLQICCVCCDCFDKFRRT